MSAVKNINKMLLANSRPERLVKGRGYYYFMNSNFMQSGVYGWNPEKDKTPLETVKIIFEDEGVKIEI